MDAHGENRHVRAEMLRPNACMDIYVYQVSSIPVQSPPSFARSLSNTLGGSQLSPPPGGGVLRIKPLTCTHMRACILTSLDKLTAPPPQQAPAIARRNGDCGGGPPAAANARLSPNFHLVSAQGLLTSLQRQTNCLWFTPSFLWGRLFLARFLNLQIFFSEPPEMNAWPPRRATHPAARQPAGPKPPTAADPARRPGRSHMGHALSLFQPGCTGMQTASSLIIPIT